MANVPDSTPVAFDLPGGDTVELYTWAAIIAKLTEPVNAIKNLITSENASLTIIEAKLEEWAEEQ